jgi:thiol-disulfide isomerase/thioredoxin
MDQHKKNLKTINEIPDLSTKAAYIAGILQIKTDLKLEIILKFLNTIYQAETDSMTTNYIENLLCTGKIGSAKEILDLYTNYCPSCKKRSSYFIDLECNHRFHKKCLEDYLIKETGSIKNPTCPACNSKIEASR